MLETISRGRNVLFAMEDAPLNQPGVFQKMAAMLGLSQEVLDSALLTAIVQSSNDAVVSKSLDGNITSWNPGAERMFGYSASEMIGQSIRLLIPARLQSEEDGIIERIKIGEPIQPFESWRLHKDGREVPVSIGVSPVFGPDGEIIGASKIARDISGEIEQRQRLAKSESWFRTLADNISQFAWMADEKGWIFWYNQRWFDYTGTTLEDMKGWGWQSVHHPDHVDRVTASLRKSWETGDAWEDTFPLRSKDGSYRWFLSRACPIRDEDGTILRWFGTNTDITEQKERQEQIEFLMGEVNHRSKNMLALVQAIARQTSASSTKEDFLTKFSARLAALSASQNLLLQSGWQGTSIRSLVASQLGHDRELFGTRILVPETDIMIDGNSAQMLGMALYELTTNATKYGALSNETGQVQLDWSTAPVNAGEAPALYISWTESGGPLVVAPSTKGFGTTVMERICRSTFGGEVALNYDPDGFSWTLTGAPGRGLDKSELTG